MLCNTRIAVLLLLVCFVVVAQATVAEIVDDANVLSTEQKDVLQKDMDSLGLNILLRTVRIDEKDPAVFGQKADAELESLKQKLTMKSDVPCNAAVLFAGPKIGWASTVVRIWSQPQCKFDPNTLKTEDMQAMLQLGYTLDSLTKIFTVLAGEQNRILDDGFLLSIPETIELNDMIRASGLSIAVKTLPTMTFAPGEVRDVKIKKRVEKEIAALSPRLKPDACGAIVLVLREPYELHIWPRKCIYNKEILQQKEIIEPLQKKEYAVALRMTLKKLIELNTDPKRKAKALASRIRALFDELLKRNPYLGPTPESVDTCKTLLGLQVEFSKYYSETNPDLAPTIEHIASRCYSLLIKEALSDLWVKRYDDTIKLLTPFIDTYTLNYFQRLEALLILAKALKAKGDLGKAYAALQTIEATSMFQQGTGGGFPKEFQATKEQLFKALNMRAKCELVQYNGNPAENWDIVLVPDGFTEEDRLAFKEEFVDTMVKDFFATQPFKSYSRKFNFYFINDFTIQDICEVKEVPMAIALNQDAKCKSPERYAQACPYDYIVVVSKKPFRSKADKKSNIFLSGMEPNLGAVLTHEFGHAFGGLFDEYLEPMQGFTKEELEKGVRKAAEWVKTDVPNCATSSEEARAKWGDLFGIGAKTHVTGAFAGCMRVETFFRPTELSKMRAGSLDTFGPANERCLLYRTLYGGTCMKHNPQRWEESGEVVKEWWK